MRTRLHQSIGNGRAGTGGLQMGDCHVGSLEFTKQGHETGNIQHCAHIVACGSLDQPAAAGLQALQASKDDLESIAANVDDIGKVDHQVVRPIIDGGSQQFLKLHRHRFVDVPVWSKNDDLSAVLGEYRHGAIRLWKTKRLYPGRVERSFG